MKCPRKASDGLHQSVQAVKLKADTGELREGIRSNDMFFNKTGIKFCPKCKSTRLEVRYLDPFSLQPKYHCRKCGFSGFLVPEAVKPEKEEN